MRFAFTIMLILSHVALIAAEEAAPIDGEGGNNAIEETFIYGVGFNPDDNSSPFRGDAGLRESLAPVRLEIDSLIKINDVQLKDLVRFINQRLPPSSEWEIKVSEAAADLRVSGDLHPHLLPSLVNLMREGKCHCRVTNGVVELRKTKGSPERIVEPAEIGPNSEAYIFGRRFGPGGELKDGELSYRGDVALIRGLEEAKLKITDKPTTEIGDIRLVDLANRLNKDHLSRTEWKVVVSEEAKEVRATGTIDENLARTLTRFMRKGNFYCKLTSGVIEFKTKDNPRGEVRPLFPDPQEKAPK